MSKNIASKNDSNINYDQMDFESIDDPNAINIASDAFVNGQNNHTNEILAEMCFLEAEDLSSRGDHVSAISSYQQACKYAPTKVNYYLKLIDLLSEDDTVKKAEQVLNKALTLFPNNLELNIRLNKLKNKPAKPNNPVNKEPNGLLEQSEINTQKGFQDDIKAITTAMGVDIDKKAKRITKNTAAILKEIDELETRNSLSTKKAAKESPFNTVKLPSVKPEENTKTTKDHHSNNAENILKEIDELEAKPTTSTLKTGTSKPTESLVETGRTANLDRGRNPNRNNFSKTKLLSPEEIKQPRHISKAKQLLLGLVFLIVIAGSSYQLFSKPAIILLGPAKENIADVKDIKFEWTCNKTVTQFVLEVYEEDSFIIKQFTKEPSYTPTPEQLARFNPERTYKWRVILPAGSGNYNFTTAMKTFSVSKGLEVTSSPDLLQNQQQIELTNQPVLPSEPIQEEKLQIKNPVHKSNPEGEI